MFGNDLGGKAERGSFLIDGWQNMKPTPPSLPPFSPTNPASLLVPDAALAAALATPPAAGAPPSRAAPRLLGKSATLTQLTRVTLATGDPGDAASSLGRGGRLRGVYDIVAVAPQSARVVEAVAAGALDVDILSLGAARPAFKLIPRTLAAVAARGVAIELRYAAAIGGGDAARRAFLTHAAAVIAAVGRGGGGGGGGRRRRKPAASLAGGVLLSSGAGTGATLRGPRDVAALAQVCGLTAPAALAAVGSRGQGVVEAAAGRRAAASGGVSAVVEGERAAKKAKR